MYKNYIKRWLDIVLSLIALAVLSLPMLFIALLIRHHLGTPVFFRQERVGKDEKIFTMLKFRTMSDKRDQTGALSPDEERQTRLGKLLRSTSLDELPELINILRGDMSIVGPRPLLVSYLPYYSEEERLRHYVRGGLTVPEVLYGNVAPSWEEQFSYEVDYAKHVSFLLDAKVIWNTVLILFKRVRSDYGSEVRKPLSAERANIIRK